MSGFEIAGIALGAFPVAVGALEHFVDGIQTIRYWRRYRVKLRDYASVMETHRVYYLDTLEELLSDIVHSDNEMELLMSQPGGPLWKDPRYERLLRQRLGRSYGAYLRLLERMLGSLSSLCERLGVDRLGKVLWDDYSMVEREMKRVKLTLLKDVYRSLLEDIDKANKDIRDITHQNIYLEPIRKKRQSKRPIAELQAIREHAASLYRLFVAGNSLNCGCKERHTATLRLERRSQSQPSEASDGRQSRFRMLLSRDLKDIAIGYQCQDIEIIPSVDALKAISIEPSEKQPATSVGMQYPRKAVKFVSDLESAARELSVQDTWPSGDTRLIKDICTTLFTFHEYELEKALGYLTDEMSSKTRRYVCYIRSDLRVPPSRSLNELLDNAQPEALQPSLFRSDRLRIAATLASSVLQLNGTNWLDPGWSSKDIIFHTSNKANELDLMFPFVPWKVCLPNDRPSSPVVTRHDHRCTTLLALGLTLVELCFGRTLVAMQKAEDETGLEMTTKVQTATRLLNTVYREMGPSYGDVVRRCILQPFDVRELDLDNEELQQKVFDDIVTPLAMDLDSFEGKLNVL